MDELVRKSSAEELAELLRKSVTDLT
jgi:hypothetical protein